MYRPYFAEAINKFDAYHRPSTVKARNNKTYEYWERALFERALFSIEFDKWPSEWGGRIKDFITYILFRNGFGAVIKHPALGILFQPCSVSGYDVYYQPTEALIANPKFTGKDKKRYEIGKDAAILQLTPDYMGIWDIIDRFACELSSMDNALDMSMINNKIAWMFGAKTKGAASALRKAFDQIQEGEPLVVFDQRIADDTTTKTEPFQHVDFNVKGNYITTDLLADMCSILRNFDAEIGIPTLPYEKKERMTRFEAQSKQSDGIARACLWRDTLQRSFDEFNELFGFDVKVKYNYEYMLDTESDDITDNPGKEGDVNE